jgi:hypothetical protein
MTDFIKFTSIEKFSDIWKMAQRHNLGKHFHRPKVKLHGTNAGIRIVDGIVVFQKRTEDVTPLADNAGFASWAMGVDWKLDRNIIIYGEWAGPGVQKSDAVSGIPQKMFFVFSILLLDVGVDEPNYVIEPEEIAKFLPENDRIHVIPWHSDPVELDTDSSDGARLYGKFLEEEVDKIGERDPYIFEKFGVDGSGEGLVSALWVPEGIVRVEHYNTYVFKVKSEAHRVQKTKSPASIHVEIPDSVRSFGTMFVTEARCQQMVDEHCGGDFAPKNIGVFLKNLNADILKESKNEFVELGVDWKVVAKVINNLGVSWFQKKNDIV